MKENFRKILSVGAIAALTLMFTAGCAKEPQSQQGTAQASYTIKTAEADYVAYSLAEQVLKDIAEIKMIIPPGSQPHGFEPLPKDIAEIEKAQFLFYINDRLEPWAKKLGGDKAFPLERNLPEVDPADPHVWMDFDNIQVMAENMAYYISSQYPDTEKQLLKNILNFHNEVDMVKRIYGQMLSNCEHKDIYHIGHLAFGYIAKRYGLNFKPLTGAKADAEPTPKDMAEMIKSIKENKVKYIFTEETLNPAISQAIARETGAQVLYLHTIEHVTKQEFEQKMTYRQLMLKNLDSLAKGLNCKA